MIPLFPNFDRVVPPITEQSGAWWPNHTGTRYHFTFTLDAHCPTGLTPPGFEPTREPLDPYSLESVQNSLSLPTLTKDQSNRAESVPTDTSASSPNLSTKDAVNLRSSHAHRASFGQSPIFTQYPMWWHGTTRQAIRITKGVVGCTKTKYS